MTPRKLPPPSEYVEAFKTRKILPVRGLQGFLYHGGTTTGSSSEEHDPSSPDDIFSQNPKRLSFDKFFEKSSLFSPDQIPDCEELVSTTQGSTTTGGKPTAKSTRRTALLRAPAWNDAETRCINSATLSEFLKTETDAEAIAGKGKDQEWLKERVARGGEWHLVMMQLPSRHDATPKADPAKISLKPFAMDHLRVPLRERRVVAEHTPRNGSGRQNWKSAEVLPTTTGGSSGGALQHLGENSNINMLLPMSLGERIMKEHPARFAQKVPPLPKQPREEKEVPSAFLASTLGERRISSQSKAAAAADVREEFGSIEMEMNMEEKVTSF